MGGEQSTSRGPGSAGQASATPRKTCYYELLGLDRQATDEEYVLLGFLPRSPLLPQCRGTSLTSRRIRKAYKKKALELHPDRNLGDTETATKRFAEVQTAYEVLADPQERAWYDSHREAILGGFENVDETAPNEHYNVRITTTEDLFALMGRFNSSLPFSDSPTGFFGVLAATFDQLADEEAAACTWDGRPAPTYPTFGASGDAFDPTVKVFYATWSTFSTKKSFSWKDRYRLSEAPDRRVRRLSMYILPRLLLIFSAFISPLPSPFASG